MALAVFIDPDVYPFYDVIRAEEPRGVLLAALFTGVMAWLTWNRSGQAFRRQMVKSDFYQTAQQTLNTAREKVDEAASSKPVRKARRDVDARLNDLAAQLPTLEYKPAKAKHGLFA